MEANEEILDSMDEDERRVIVGTIEEDVTSGSRHAPPWM